MAARSDGKSKRRSKSASTSPHTEIISRGLLIHSGRVLLCLSPRGGYGYLPGGHVEFGESAGAALQRELVEELGLRVRVGPPLLVHEYAFVDPRGVPHHELNAVFHVEARRARDLDSLRSREEHIRFEMVSREQLARTRILPMPMKRWLIDRLAAGDAAPMAAAWLTSRFPSQIRASPSR